VLYSVIPLQILGKAGMGTESLPMLRGSAAVEAPSIFLEIGKLNLLGVSSHSKISILSNTRHNVHCEEKLDRVSYVACFDVYRLLCFEKEREYSTE
jgi:hypothetical protein